MDATKGMQTLAIHAGEEADPTTGALVPPLYLATTYHLGSTENGAALFAGEKEGYVYTRWANPTVNVLEKRVAALEGGAAAVATASGMAAITTALLANGCSKGDLSKHLRGAESRFRVARRGNHVRGRDGH